MIAIHHRPDSFSDKWIEYCVENGIKYKIVNCFDTDIIQKLKDCKGLMWHWQHNDFKAQLFARQLILSLETSGLKIFPDSNTGWHYDDKIGQKYLLEAIEAPLVPSYTFYNKSDALEWAKQCLYPKVHKTRNGAGSQNVQLVKNFEEARKLINKAFNKGIPSYDKYAAVKENIWRFKRDKSPRSLFRIGKYISLSMLPNSFQFDHVVEKNYAYFQDFIPNNNFDIRIVVIGDRAVAFKRFTRENDFRASGSGKFDTNPNSIPLNCIETSFEVTKKLNASCLAFDFILDEGDPLIVEISYAFGNKVPPKCRGYWDAELNWHEQKIVMEYFMIADFVRDIKR